MPVAHTVNSMAEDKVREIRKAMTPKQKLNAAMQLYWSARELKSAYIRSIHPEWSDEQIHQAVREAFMKSRS
jgi:hypothetical protein